MVDAPVPPLFGDERVASRWSAHYLPRSPRPDAPGVGLQGWMGAARNQLLTGRRDAVAGELWLTTWRLIFRAVPDRGHQLRGQFSLFLPRLSLLRWNPSGWFEVAHVGSKNPVLWTHEFRVASSAPAYQVGGARAALLPSLELHKAMTLSFEHERRKNFETLVAAAWWRAGLGLLTGASLAALPELDRDEGYRVGGPPPFEELNARLQGLEGEGLAQLRWLLQPDEPEPAGFLPPPLHVLERGPGGEASAPS